MRDHRIYDKIEKMRAMLNVPAADAQSLFEQARAAEGLANLLNPFDYHAALNELYDKAMERCEQAANMGHTEAMYELGNMYCSPSLRRDTTKAVHWIGKAAEQGLAQAQYSFGCMYIDEKSAEFYHVKQDAARAVEWFRKAAEQGYAQAQRDIGNCYYNGTGVKRDRPQAREWYTRAIDSYRKLLEQGYGYAEREIEELNQKLEDIANNKGGMKDTLRSLLQRIRDRHNRRKKRHTMGERFEQAKAFIKNKETDKAAPLIAELVDEGHAGAMYYMNKCWVYMTRQGYSFEKARDLMRKSAKRGYAAAQYELGRWARDGEWPEKGAWGNKDPVKAAEWFRKAAEQGYTEAQNQLGRCYKDGTGVSQDKAKAVEWFLKAAEQGDADAQNNLGHCYEDGEGVAQDYAKALEWYGKAAAQDDFSGRSNLDSLKVKGLLPEQAGIDDRLERANILYDKKGIYDEALKLFEELANEGNAEAQYRLSRYFNFGKFGVERDYNKEVELLRKSAEQGFADAQFQLGWYCFYGIKGVVTVDMAKAAEWWNKAAAKGHADAQFELGLCLYYGKGTAQDRAKAIEWWGKAQGSGHGRAKYRYDITLTETEDVLETITASECGELRYNKPEGALVEKGESPFSLFVQYSTRDDFPLMETGGTPAEYAGTLHCLVDDNGYVSGGQPVAQILKNKKGKSKV